MKPTPEPSSFIALGRRRLDVQRVEFGIRVDAEAWVDGKRQPLYGAEHATAEYWLSVKVDERSGQDGAPWPEADVIPVARAAKRHPFVSELAGLTVDDDDDWEAWFGNDAPELEDNRLTFGAWNPTRKTIGLEWRATYETRAGTKPFRFVGAATFKGITLSVRAAEDADAIVRRVFGDDYRVCLSSGGWDQASS